MRKLLSSPAKMTLSETENAIYQVVLKNASELLLNLMAIKVEDRPEDFLGWSYEMLRLCRHSLNMDLLEDAQLRPLKKLQEALESGISATQIKMLRIAPWPIFSGFIAQQEQIQSIAERLKLLQHINEIKHTALADMAVEDRLAYAGKHTQNHDYSVYDFDVEWFGSTKGAKVFHSLLQQKPIAFDNALANIPLEGDISFEQYLAFVSAYKDIFTSFTDDKPQGEKAPLAAATRLLAMRRPDYFISLTNTKIDALCQGFSIPKFNAFDFNGYWHDLIGSIKTCAWWHQAMPEGEEQQELWHARAILVDAFFYASEEQAEQSNFIRLRDKVKNANLAKSTGTTRQKRTKETAEMLVDRALAADDMPAYIQNKRDSIVSEVKNGKSVEHVIGLMRAIFG